MRRRLKRERERDRAKVNIMGQAKERFFPRVPTSKALGGMPSHRTLNIILIPVCVCMIEKERKREKEDENVGI